MSANDSTFISDPKLANKVEVKKEGDRSISFSQYTKYFKCPRSWELNYILKIKEQKESIDLILFKLSCFAKEIIFDMIAKTEFGSAQNVICINTSIA